VLEALPAIETAEPLVAPSPNLAPMISPEAIAPEPPPLELLPVEPVPGAATLSPQPSLTVVPTSPLQNPFKHR
jgi:hypothetical protein